MIFQTKVAPFTLIKGTLFRMGPDDQLCRCLKKLEQGKVVRALHSGPSGGHFVLSPPSTGSGKPDIGGHISTRT